MRESAKSERDARRFWANVDRSGPVIRVELGPCWLWTKPLGPSGYGRMRFRNSMWRSNRIAFELCVGSIPNGMLVCHKCDVRHCVNPDHLFLGTPLDNTTDMISKGRRVIPIKVNPAKGERNASAKLTEARVRAIRKSYDAGGRSYKEIGREHGVHLTTVHLVVTRKHWSHVS